MNIEFFQLTKFNDILKNVTQTTDRKDTITNSEAGKPHTTGAERLSPYY